MEDNGGGVGVEIAFSALFLSKAVSMPLCCSTLPDLVAELWEGFVKERFAPLYVTRYCVKVFFLLSPSVSSLWLFIHTVVSVQIVLYTTPSSFPVSPMRVCTSLVLVVVQLFVFVPLLVPLAFFFLVVVVVAVCFCCFRALILTAPFWLPPPSCCTFRAC